MKARSGTTGIAVQTANQHMSFGARLWRNLYKYRWLHLFLLPGVVYYIIFSYVPMYGVLLAFKNFKGSGGYAGIWSAPWVGMAWFRSFFKSIYFPRLLRNTLLLSLYRIVFVFPAPIILALLINEIGNGLFKRTVQTITYMPYFLSWVVAAGLIITLLSPTSGPVNLILSQLFHIQPIYFVTETRYFRTILIVSDIWKGVGWGSIVYLAAITGIDQEMYEAAMIDGATRWQRIWHITLPSLKEIIAIMFILQIGRILNQNFDQIFNLYSEAVYEVGDVFETYVYRSGVIDAKFSYSTAVGLFKSVISLVLVYISNFVAKKLGTSGLW